MLRALAAFAISVLRLSHEAWPALAVVPFPGSLNVGSDSSSLGAGTAVSAHDALMTAVALAVEIALFVLVPIYLRARRRAQIRSTIRMSYDSRRNPAAVPIPTIHVVSADAPGKRSRPSGLRLVGGWGEHRFLRQS